MPVSRLIEPESVDVARYSSALSYSDSGMSIGYLGLPNLLRKWEAREISNFEYLMHLNILAGRTYSDLNQYPVFPWILADYTSETLDLDDACTYRDLSKPMGAQSKARAKVYRDRYDSWLNCIGDDMVPFHYGTHYSSSAIVASYLVRLEPFTKHFIKVQGGQFDHPDRMFHSIEEAWHSASELNYTDVKELIPEFFYMPEFLLNSNKFVYGNRQNGQVFSCVQ